MDVRLCLKVLERASESGSIPEFFNTDLGSRYTSEDGQRAIKANSIRINMDGKGGRWADNVIIKRFWRTFKHEFFLHQVPNSLEKVIEMTAKWLEYYNKERPTPHWVI